MAENVTKGLSEGALRAFGAAKILISPHSAWGYAKENSPME